MFLFKIIIIIENTINFSLITSKSYWLSVDYTKYILFQHHRLPLHTGPNLFERIDLATIVLGDVHHS